MSDAKDTKGGGRSEAAEKAPASKASAAAENAGEELAERIGNSLCAYHQAIQEAWEARNQTLAKAQRESSMAMQRVIQDTSKRFEEARRTWSSAMQAMQSQSDQGQQIRQSNDAYQAGLKEAYDQGSERWEGCQRTLQDSLTAAQSDYEKAVDKAFRHYVTEVKGAWAQAKVDSLDPAALGLIGGSIYLASQSAQACLGRT